MSLVDRYFGWRERQAMASYERGEVSTFLTTREQPKNRAEISRISNSRGGLNPHSLKDPVIPRGFAGS